MIKIISFMLFISILSLSLCVGMWMGWFDTAIKAIITVVIIWGLTEMWREIRR